MTLTSRHGNDVLVEVFIVDEEWVDEVGRCDDVFTDHTTNCRRFTISTWANSLFVCNLFVWWLRNHQDDCIYLFECVFGSKFVVEIIDLFEV